MTAVLIILAVILVLIMGMSLMGAGPSRIQRRTVVESPVRRRTVVEQPVRERVVDEPVRERAVEERPGTSRRYVD